MFANDDELERQTYDQSILYYAELMAENYMFVETHFEYH